MSILTFIEPCERCIKIPEGLLRKKRHLTPSEISVLEDNLNSCDDGLWENVYVDDDRMGFDPTLIKSSHFSGFVILGRIWPALLKHHDLELRTGITNSRLRNVVTGNDNAILNAAYLENYRLGDRVMIFNVQEMNCTNHSKFGNGILKEGEPESTRITVAVANENGGREILPFEKMICADAYIWSKYRADSLLMEKLKEMTERDFSKKCDEFGTVGDDAVIKNTTLIKDAKIGANCYIKGAFKLKNVTILSTPDEVSQIGEGVEMVNGIMAEGSRVFYQAVAVRFVIGKNCQLKYGARLLNSVLGDNSTVSCCELLNNLIYPFHEQHHNSSFLISSTVMGQSNIAAGATIGSNHNSRSPDGEIIAGRGFWAGLCTSFKHNSTFSPFILAGKGDYHHELSIDYPFSLVSPGETSSSPVKVLPAWYFMNDTYAIMRNRYKFKARDKRFIKIQNIETDPIAPDTVQEILKAVSKILSLTFEKLCVLFPERFENVGDKKSAEVQAKTFLESEATDSFVLFDPSCQKKYGALVYGAQKAYATYIDILKLFSVASIMEYCKEKSFYALTKKIVLEKLKKLPVHTEWINAGGQVIPSDLVNELIEKIKSGKIETWEAVHDFYDFCEASYTDLKAGYSVHILESVYSKKLEDFTEIDVQDLVKSVKEASERTYTSSFESRKKDYTDSFRTMTYDSQEEMISVLGTLEENAFLNILKSDVDSFNQETEEIFGGFGS